MVLRNACGTDAAADAAGGGSGDGASKSR